MEDSLSYRHMPHVKVHNEDLLQYTTILTKTHLTLYYQDDVHYHYTVLR